MFRGLKPEEMASRPFYGLVFTLGELHLIVTAYLRHSEKLFLFFF